MAKQWIEKRKIYLNCDAYNEPDTVENLAPDCQVQGLRCMDQVRGTLMIPDIQVNFTLIFRAYSSVESPDY